MRVNKLNEQTPTLGMYFGFKNKTIKRTSLVLVAYSFWRVRT